MLLEPERFANQPFEAVAGDGVAELSSDGKPKAAPRQPVRQSMHDYTQPPRRVSRFEDRVEFPGVCQALARGETEFKRHEAHRVRACSQPPNGRASSPANKSFFTGPATAPRPSVR